MGVVIEQVLGKTMAELTGQYELGCVALIKLSLKDAGRDAAVGLDYAAWKGILENDVKKRLTRMNVKEPERVVQQLVKTLQKNQSLLTMAVR